jgi:uncharacterized protein YecE (DUF72 family)
MQKVCIGCSGFNYPHWKGVFYPEDLPQKKWLKHYCSVFSTVELNVTFYRLPTETSFDRWYKETPDDFVFSVKGSRFITHVKKLIDPQKSLKLFFKGALRLKEKLNVILWQLPPSFGIDVQRLKVFLDLLASYPVRCAIEFRNRSWITEEVADICRKRHTALCMADWPVFADKLPVTSDFVYIRRHGRDDAHDICYSKTELKGDADRIKKHLKNKQDVYIYFNNDAQGCAPANAKELAGLLKVR